MIKLKNLAGTVAALGTCFAFAGCGGSGNVTLTPPPVRANYVQIERLSRPAIKEVFEPYQDHQKSNVVEPYSDSTIFADIPVTEDAVRYGGTPAAAPDYGKILQGILYPDEYTVNLSGAAPSGADPEYFLSYEVEGAFGGRAPNDDVIDLELGILFGNTLHAAVPKVPDDGKENHCLSSQNIALEDPSKKTRATFPYLPVPH
jgi:hypothetical protein